MRIGIDAKFYNSKNSSLALYTDKLVHAMLELPQAQDHHFVIFLPKSVNSHEINHANIEYVATPIRPFSVSEQLQFSRLISRYKLDVMHFLHSNHPWLYRGTTITTLHDFAPLYDPNLNTVKRMFYELNVWHAAKSSHEIMVVTEPNKHHLMGRYRAEPDKISVIPSGVGQEFKKSTDSKLIAQIKERYKIDKPYLLWIGEPGPHKNIGRLLEAFASVYARNRSLQLVMIGHISLRNKEIADLIKRLHLEKAVILPGVVPSTDVSLLLSGAEMYIEVALTSGLGLSLLEAFACECPTLASNARSIVEIGDGAALYCDPLNPVDIAEKIVSLLDNEALQQVVVAAGLSRTQEFSWQKTAASVLAVYNKYMPQTDKKLSKRHKPDKNEQQLKGDSVNSDMVSNS